MHKSLIAAAAAAVALSMSAEPYKVVAPLGEDAEGAMARLVDIDTNTTLDSVLVADGAAVFSGDISEPTLARVYVDESRQPVFILEPGSISFGENGAFGTMLNDQLRELGQQINALGAQFQQAQNDEARQAIEQKYQSLLDSTLTANADNMLGYYVFVNGEASSLSATELRAELQKYPTFAERGRVKKMLSVADCREATQPGKKFLDFEISYEGKTFRLSDYVGKGRYTLVDFWASWCGPCMRQTPVIKGLYEKYKDKGLDVIGVAVWDEPADTQAAIDKHGITWMTVLNGQTIPTDIYGIAGIPCIILFGPDGTIISRDKQGDELVADVDAAMAGK